MEEEKRETQNQPAEEEDQIVNPWEVAAKDGGKIDYDKLIDKFGCQRLDQTLIDRVHRLTVALLTSSSAVASSSPTVTSTKSSTPMKRLVALWFALNLIKFVSLLVFRYLQDVFRVPLVIQLTDDEKCMWKNLTVEESQRLARENAKDIIACGFDITRTFIFSDFDYVGGAFYKNMVKVAKCVTLNKVQGIFGFSGEDHIGKISFPPVQDPYFRMTRDAAPRIGISQTFID
ncbi:hypothetical protein NC652_024206 [Populus alba x Populus x berolinensis]|nr:hypothetical protein NC652_024206 [Populus alba x Populus x berolinensis]